MRTILGAFLFCVLIVGFGARAEAEKRIALVIGNSSYTDAPLNNPKNDAALMGDTLERVGFEVIRLVDADLRTMRRAMVDFGRKLRGSDSVGLFYYAGHGVQVEGENFLIPIGAVVHDELEVAIEGVSVNDFLRTMKRASSRINIVVLDACRNNPFARSYRSSNRGLARVDAPKGTYVAYATSPGSVALDGTAGNSPYTAALAKAMVKPGLAIEQVFKQARRDVLAATDEKQTPWETSSIVGRFYFSKLNEPKPKPKPAVQATDNQGHELAYWNTIKDLNEPELYSNYLRQYPNGSFADLARFLKKRAEKLRAPSSIEVTPSTTEQKPPTPPIEASETEQKEVALLDTGPVKTPAVDPSQTLWAAIENSDNAEDFEFYLRQYPKGAHSAQARLRIASISKVPEPEIPSAAETTPVTSRTLIKELQTRLYELDYNPGPRDGVAGPATRSAIKRYQKDASLKQDGEPTLAVVQRLRNAASLSPWGAIVFSDARGTWGMSWGKSTRQEAVDAAQETCAQGSAHCKSEVTFFKGQCGAFSYSDNGWGLAMQETVKLARDTAVATCNRRGRECRTIAAVCADGGERFVESQ